MKGHVLIIGVLVLIVSILVSLNIFFQQSLQMEIAEEFNKQQLLIADSLANNVSNHVRLLRERTIAAAAQLCEATECSLKNAGALAESITTDTHNIKIDVAVLSLSGGMRFHTSDPEMIHRSLPQILSIAADTADMSAGMLEADPFIHIIAPVIRNKSRIAVVVVSFSMSSIASHYINELRQHGKGNLYLLDSAGTLIFHPSQPNMVGKSINKTEKSCTECHLSFNLWQDIVRGKFGQQGRFVAPSGEDRMIAFSKPAAADSWIVFVSAPVSEITASTRKSMTFYSYLIIAILVTTITVSTALIYFNRKRVQAEEVEKRQEQMEQYAHELEDKVRTRTSELFSEKEKLNSIVSAIGSGIMLLDRKGVVQWTNQLLEDMAGEPLIGKSFEDLCADCQVSGSHEDNNIQTDMMSDMFGKRGRLFQVTTAPVRNDIGEITGYIRMIHDVTEIRRMEEQLSNSEKLASIGRLAAGIAHEIGNPLTSIFSFVQILREIEDDEFKKESLQTVCFHVNRISEILKQLSGFSKMPVAEPKECQINEIIKTSIHLIQYDKRAKDIEITTNLDPDLPSIVVDGNQLSQVFVNLVLNAIDAMPEGGMLTVSSALRNNEIRVKFRDTGIGIPAEELSVIFDPFYTTKEKGTGLGLSVSYTIVRKMNGTITVESEVGHGTTFTVRLPIRIS
ncbi:MAG TPA: ATP-binding protein [Dissulfurispiraceae bacterium]|nr:ATP-binding protein [Dissulfurispiraceae bacterium]